MALFKNIEELRRYAYWQQLKIKKLIMESLHQILPNQRVDSGPVVDQIIFDIKDLSFEGIIKQSFNELVNIFELNIDTIINDQFSLNEVILSSKSYSYSDLNELCMNFSGADIKNIQFRKPFNVLSKIKE